MDERYDVVVVGGGAAGLNGALMLGRSRRSVLVVDAGEPRNAPAAAIHGLLGREGMAPAELLARGRAEVAAYGVDLATGTVLDIVRAPDGFALRISGDRTVRARRLLVTTGVVDELPAIDGLRAHWGTGVLHCPYCHGWEARDQAIGVLATGPMSIHQALLFRQLSDDVVFFAHGTDPTPESRATLAAVGIAVVEGTVRAVKTAGGRVAGVRLADGTVVPRHSLVVASRPVARADFLRGLGLELVEHPSGAGQHLPVDAMGRTDVAGVWAAGNVTEPFAQVGAAAAAGAFAAAQINADLVLEQARLAVTAARTDAVQH
ncbi:MAG TPA: NAD(P)/FAD-dependent oxidoreductase [Nakamurella multipartita]|nr:NAD(P)/FAD-dependent oxidoreductase [Nakamurella multipartita]